jgi:hypothetical protein
MMSSIVKYTDAKPAENRYPERIISPRKSGACCFSDMEMVGETHAEGRWVFQYRRCRKCGFAVRVILRQIPDDELMAAVRKDFANLFVRRPPDF